MKKPIAFVLVVLTILTNMLALPRVAEASEIDLAIVVSNFYYKSVNGGALMLVLKEGASPAAYSSFIEIGQVASTHFAVPPPASGAWKQVGAEFFNSLSTQGKTALSSLVSNWTKAAGTSTLRLLGAKVLGSLTAIKNMFSFMDILTMLLTVSGFVGAYGLPYIVPQASAALADGGDMYERWFYNWMVPYLQFGGGVKGSTCQECYDLVAGYYGGLDVTGSYFVYEPAAGLRHQICSGTAPFVSTADVGGATSAFCGHFIEKVNGELFLCAIKPGGLKNGPGTSNVSIPQASIFGTSLPNGFAVCNMSGSSLFNTSPTATQNPSPSPSPTTSPTRQGSSQPSLTTFTD